MMFAAAVGHRSGRATPSLRGAPQRQSMEIVRRETIYRNRNAVQTNPATSWSTISGFLTGFTGLKTKRFSRSDCRCRIAPWLKTVDDERKPLLGYGAIG
jgi:hypothetical protein